MKKLANIDTFHELSCKIYDQEVSESYLRYLGLPRSHWDGFALQPCSMPNCARKDAHNHLRITRPERANELNVPVWHRVNEVLHPKKRCYTGDVTNILNFVTEYDCNWCPEVAEPLGLLYHQFMVDKGLAPSGIPLINSGGGGHSIINLPGIKPKDEQDATLLNDTMLVVQQQYFAPLFAFAKQMVEIQYGVDLSTVQLEGTDIARILSGPGDWRPSIKENDHYSLKSGVMRTVVGNKSLFRHPWIMLQNTILLESTRVFKEQETAIKMGVASYQDFDLEYQFTREELKAYQPIFYLNKFKGDIKQAVSYRLEWYMQQKPLPLRSDGISIDRSALSHRLFWYLAHITQSAEFAYMFRVLINQKAGEKFDTDERLDMEAKRSLGKWPGPKNLEDQEKQRIARVTRIREKTDARTFFAQAVRMIWPQSDRIMQPEISKTDFLERYAQVCLDHGIDQLGENQVTSELLRLNITSIRKTINNQKVRVYVEIPKGE